MYGDNEKGKMFVNKLEAENTPANVRVGLYFDGSTSEETSCEREESPTARTLKYGQSSLSSWPSLTALVGRSPIK